MNELTLYLMLKQLKWRGRINRSTQVWFEIYK